MSDDKFHFQQIVKVIFRSPASMSEVFILQDTNFMNNSMQNLYKNVQQATSANRSGERFCIFLISVKDLVSAGPMYPTQLHYIWGIIATFLFNTILKFFM